MDNRKDLEYSISKNFQFKNKFSKSSLEHAAYENLVAGESTVANRMAKQEWIQSLLLNSKDAIAQILEMKRTGRNKDGQELSPAAQATEIEQLKLRVLHELGWSYSGSFLPGAEETYTDAQGVVRERGDSYPELSFFITSRKNGDSYWYATSYGIMKSSDSSDFGSYSYFATLDEALEFINDELLIVGRNALYKKIMREAVREEVRKDNIKSMNDELYKKYVTKARPNAEKRVNALISERVITEKFHNIRRSTDIFVLPDLIEMFLLPISDSYLRVAKQGEFREKKARQITDTVAIDLDEDDNMEVADTSEIALKSPEEALRDVEYDAIRKNRAQNEQEAALSDNTQVKDFEPGQGGNLFDSQSASVPLVPVTDKEDLSNKPASNPAPAKEIEQGQQPRGMFTTIASSQLRKESAEKDHQESASIKVATDVDDSMQDATSALPLVAAFDNRDNRAPSTRSVSVSGDVDDTFNAVANNSATVALSDSLEDSFEVVPHVEQSNASVAVSGDVEDSFIMPKIAVANVDVHGQSDDTLCEGWNTATVVLNGDIENTRAFASLVQNNARDFDAIEVDVAQETWDTIRRDLDGFFDDERLPVRLGNAALADDLDIFI